jgi:hypothetical protein
MKLVQLPTTQIWINPEYVTSIRQTVHGTTIEYEGNAGYRTRTETVKVPVEDVISLFMETST